MAHRDNVIIIKYSAECCDFHCNFIKYNTDTIQKFYYTVRKHVDDTDHRVIVSKTEVYTYRPPGSWD